MAVWWSESFFTDNGGDLHEYNDLWKFESSTGEWTWVSGSDIPDQSGVYGIKGTGSTNNNPGARGISVSWIDASENLWLFGGGGHDSFGNPLLLNDLWKFEPSTGEWTWVSGDDEGGQPGVYGTKGIARVFNKPGARTAGVSWIDISWNIWLFGGWGYDVSGHEAYLNDLWKFEP